MSGDHPFMTAQHADNIVESVRALNMTCVRLEQTNNRLATAIEQLVERLDAKAETNGNGAYAAAITQENR